MLSQSDDSAELLHAESECGVEMRRDLKQTDTDMDLKKISQIPIVVVVR